MNKEANKTKIVFFLQSLNTGGAEKSAVRLANALNKDKFEVSFLIGFTGSRLVNDLSGEIKVMDMNRNKIIFSLFEVIKYFNTNNPDIVISFLDRVNIINILAGIFCKKKPKIIITERSTFSRVPIYASKKIINKLIGIYVLPILVKIFYKKANAIVCVSKGVAQDLSLVIGNLKTIKVIYNPVVDGSLLILSKEKINDLGFDNLNLPTIVAVGRLTKAKDYPTLLKAFSLVIPEIPARLLIIGEGEDREEIQNLIRDLKISEKVFLLGFKENPLKYIKASDIFVLSSKLEGFPNSLVEAMACGVPVVATDCQSGPNEIIENEESGFLVPVGKEEMLARKIIELLKNKDLREMVSKKGIKRAEYFSVDKSVKEFEYLFLTI